MFKKIMFGLMVMTLVISIAHVAAAQVTCEVNGQTVACPEFDAGLIAAMIKFMAVFFLVILVLSVLMIVSMWKIFSKAGKPGWAAIIPIYNTIVTLDIARRPLWWFFLLLIPFVNIVVGFILIHDISKMFGKDMGFTLGLIFLPFIFYPILAFGKATYLGMQPVAASVPQPAPVPPQPPMPPVQ